MAKGNDKKVKEAVTASSQYNQEESNKSYDSFNKKNTGNTDEFGELAKTEHSDVYGKYAGFANSGGITPEQAARLRATSNMGSGGSGGGGGGGGVNKGKLGGSGDYFGDVGMMGRGTFDDAERAYQNMDLTTAKRFASTGGLENADLDRWRGGGVYDEFSRTGGISDADSANMRARALSPISAYASGERDELARRRNVQGGYAPGFDASQRALKRDTSRNIAATSLDAELGISDRQREGRQWGAEGMSRTEGEIETLRTQNQLEGSRQVASIQQAIASGMMSASQGRAMIDQTNQQTRLAIASGRTQRDIAKLQMQAAAGNASAARSLAKAQMDSQNERFLIDSEQRGQMFGISGMADTYRGTAAQYESGMDRGLSGINSQAQSNMGYSGMLLGQPPNQGFNWGQVANTAGNIAATYYGNKKPAGNTGIAGGGSGYPGSQPVWV